MTYQDTSDIPAVLYGLLAAGAFLLLMWGIGKLNSYRRKRAERKWKLHTKTRPYWESDSEDH